MFSWVGLANTPQLFIAKQRSHALAPLIPFLIYSAPINPLFRTFEINGLSSSFNNLVITFPSVAEFFTIFSSLST